MCETERGDVLGGVGGFLEEFDGKGRKRIGVFARERISSRS